MQQFKAGTREEMANDIGSVVCVLISMFGMYGQNYFSKDEITTENFLEVMQSVERFIALGNFKASDLGVNYEKLVTLQLIAEEIQQRPMSRGVK